MNININKKEQVSRILKNHKSATLLLLLSRFSHVRLGATPKTAAYQAPPSLGFSRQEHWSWVPLPSPKSAMEDIKNPIENE